MIDYGFIFIFANNMMFMPIHVQEDIFNYIKNDDLSFDNTFNFLNNLSKDIGRSYNIYWNQYGSNS
jgi:hypothetical protein